MTNLQPSVETLYTSIREVLETARNAARHAVNFAMVQAYWNVGRLILEHEQAGEKRAPYAEGLLSIISKRLSQEYGQGYSVANLKNFRQFYQVYPIRYAVRSELSWTHYRALMRVENQAARQFYEEESIRANWGTRALERQIHTFYYERLLSSRDKAAVQAEATANAKKDPPNVRDFIKDPFVLEFLGLQHPSHLFEKELEQHLMDNLQQFLLEMGRGFAFVARQQYLSIEGEPFRIDLVFYNFLLKCFFLVDLKMGKLEHGDVGQMDMYVRLYEEKFRGEGDNPTVGLILCSEKNEAVAKYSMLRESKQLFASRYSFLLPSEEDLRRELERERRILEEQAGNEF